MIPVLLILYHLFHVKVHDVYIIPRTYTWGVKLRASILLCSRGSASLRETVIIFIEIVVGLSYGYSYTGVGR